MSVDLLVILAYVAVQLVIGWAVSRRVRTEDDYLLAGRRLGPGVATFTIFATWFGAETCIGAAGAVHDEGLTAISHDPLGYAGCLLLVAAVFARPLWSRGLTTLADLFRSRFSSRVERLAVLLMVPTSLMWAGAQIRAFGQVLSASSDLQVIPAIALAAAVVITYTAMGGLLADAITDVVQGAVLVIGLVVLGGYLLAEVGSPLAALDAVDPERLRIFGEPGRPLLEIVEAWAVPILGSVVAQELIARVLASRSPAVAQRATYGATALYLTIGLVPVMVGLLGPALVSLEAGDGEQVLPRVAEHLLPRPLYLLLIGALVSAMLSTVDSALLVASSLVSHNLAPSFKRDLSERSRVRLARFGVVAFGILAWLLATFGGDVHDLVLEASAFGSAGIFVITVAGLFTRGGGEISAILALLFGVGTYAVLSYGTTVPCPFLISVFAALLGYVAGMMPISRLAARPPPELEPAGTDPGVPSL